VRGENGNHREFDFAAPYLIVSYHPTTTPILCSTLAATLRATTRNLVKRQGAAKYLSRRISHLYKTTLA